MVLSVNVKLGTERESVDESVNVDPLKKMCEENEDDIVCMCVKCFSTFECKRQFVNHVRICGRTTDHVSAKRRNIHTKENSCRKAKTRNRYEKKEQPSIYQSNSNRQHLLPELQIKTELMKDDDNSFGPTSKDNNNGVHNDGDTFYGRSSTIDRINSKTADVANYGIPTDSLLSAQSGGDRINSVSNNVVNKRKSTETQIEVGGKRQMLEGEHCHTYFSEKTNTFQRQSACDLEMEVVTNINTEKEGHSREKRRSNGINGCDSKSEIVNSRNHECSSSAFIEHVELQKTMSEDINCVNEYQKNNREEHSFECGIFHQTFSTKRNIEDHVLNNDCLGYDHRLGDLCMNGLGERGQCKKLGRPSCFKSIAGVEGISYHEPNSSNISYSSVLYIAKRIENACCDRMDKPDKINFIRSDNAKQRIDNDTYREGEDLLSTEGEKETNRSERGYQPYLEKSSTSIIGGSEDNITVDSGADFEGENDYFTAVSETSIVGESKVKNAGENEAIVVGNAIEDKTECSADNQPSYDYTDTESKYATDSDTDNYDSDESWKQSSCDDTDNESDQTSESSTDIVTLEGSRDCRNRATSSESKKYECNICRVKFKMSHHLSRHMGSHCGEKPFECGKCHKRFGTKFNLKKHEVRIHWGESWNQSNCDNSAANVIGESEVHIAVESEPDIAEEIEADIVVKSEANIVGESEADIAVVSEADFAGESEAGIADEGESDIVTEREDNIKRAMGKTIVGESEDSIVGVNKSNSVVQSETNITGGIEGTIAGEIEDKIVGEIEDKGSKAIIERKDKSTSDKHDTITSTASDYTPGSGEVIGNLEEPVDCRESTDNTASRKYECNICHFKFKYPCHLSRHMEIHRGKKPFECGKCHKTFGRKYHLKRHEVRIHCGENTLECDTCRKAFTTTDSLKWHITNRVCLQDQTSTQMQVIHENITISYPTRMECNTDIVGEGEVYFAKKCDTNSTGYIEGNIAKDINANNAGKSKATSAGKSEANIVDVNANNKVLNRAANTAGEIGANVAGGIVANDADGTGVNIEGERGVNNEDISKSDEHPNCRKRTTNATEMKHECNICHIRFKCKSNFRRHMRNHRGERQFECGKCQKKFSQRYNLKRHELARTCIARKCDTNSTGYIEGNIAKDINANNAGKSKATIAGESEANIVGVNANNKVLNRAANTAGEIGANVAGGIVANDADETGVNIEGERGVNNEDITKSDEHPNCRKRTTNATEMKHECNICHIRFKCKSNFRRHMRNHRGERQFECGKCQKKFSQRYNLKRHEMARTCIARKCDTNSTGYIEGNIAKDINANNAGKSKATIAGESEANIVGVNANNKVLNRAANTAGEIGANVAGGIVANDADGTGVNIEGERGVNNEDITKSDEHPNCRKRTTNATVMKHECNICHLRFKLRSSFRRHLRNHRDERQFECGKCHKKFGQRYNLKRHELARTCLTRHGMNTKQTSTADRKHGCNICHLRFTTITGYKRHMRSHSGERPFECGKCYKRFSEKYNLTRHELTNHGIKPVHIVPKRSANSSNKTGPLICEICQTTFKRSYSLRKHKENTACAYRGNYAENMMVDDSSSSESELEEQSTESTPGCYMEHYTKNDTNFNCNHCHMTFRSRNNIEYHIKSQLDKMEKGKASYLCKLCNTEFDMKCKLACHRVIEHGGNTFKCTEKDDTDSECGELFSSYRKLQRHIVCYHRKKSFLCDICGHVSKTPYHLKIHRMTHRKEKSHRCNTCGNYYKSEESLKAHVKYIHFREFSYLCELCPKKFVRKMGLIKHTITHTKEKPYKCKKCGVKFASDHSMKRHEVTHTMTKNFACKLCDKSFTQSQSLTRHMITHTGKTPYRCEPCGLDFREGYRLKLHREKAHRLVVKKSKRRKHHHDCI